ncbi:MAG: ComEC/Rec2 family competence protein [Candidatus Eisenbacteria bacterium]
MRGRHFIPRSRRVSGWPGLWAAGVLLAGLSAGVATPPSAAFTRWPAIAVVGCALAFARREGSLLLALFVSGYLCGLEAGEATRYRPPEALGLAESAEPFENDANLTVLLRAEECGGPPGEERFRARLLGLAQPNGWHHLREPIEVRGRAAIVPGKSYVARGRFRREQAPLPIDRVPRFLFAPSRLFSFTALDSAHSRGARVPPIGWRGIDRYRWAAKLEARLGPEAGALAEWALLDVRPSVAGSSWSEPFRRTGTSHLLSISGIHLVLIGGMFFLATKVLTRGSPLSLPISVGALVGYTLMVGAPPAAMRAAWMAVFAM